MNLLEIMEFAVCYTLGYMIGISLCTVIIWCYLRFSSGDWDGSIVGFVKLLLKLKRKVFC